MVRVAAAGGARGGPLEAAAGPLLVLRRKLQPRRYPVRRGPASSFLGVDCPDLPLEALLAAASASSAPGVAAVCPASDGGYTLLALPEGADERLCFSDVRWSAGDTCLSQLQALTRAGLTSAVLETHSDVDELPDLRALWARLAGEPDSTSQCPHTRAMLAALATSAPAVLCG